MSPPAIESTNAVQATTTLPIPEISVNPETVSVSSDGESSDERSLTNKVSDEFRPSHHNLITPDLKRSDSASSISSYDALHTSSNDSYSTNMLALGESGALAQNWFSSGTLKADGRWFKDEQERICLLRGVNFCGNSKLPTKPNGSSHLSEGFFDHRNVSFVGRPLPLEEVHQHFARLRTWGLTFVRLLVTWESLEHSGP
jgi:hypothetical protein